MKLCLSSPKLNIFSIVGTLLLFFCLFAPRYLVSFPAAYCVALDSHRPGTGFIAFSGSSDGNVYREYFTVTPHGFFFRGRVLPSVEHVITAFKMNPNYR